MLEPGQIFAHRYRVNRRIAEGGMGAIFEAEHTATERKVALKLLFPHIMSVASARKKFELEAKISARVNSRNIVEVIDAGFDEATQSPFLVMELLAGQTLAQFVRDNGPLEIDQALVLLEQIAAGLDAAHGYREPNGVSKPIVHRDLKPENLFMAQDHGAFVMKILDFGIAKVLGETGNVSQEVRGTPLYMAFEQVTAGPLSPQTDVWALGLIAYYMLTGTNYWRAANQPSANVQSLFAEILSLPLEPPSVRMRQQNVPVQLPLAFDAWLLECVQRDSTRRFASAGVAVAALARAFGTSMRPRPRFDSKPAPPPAFAATEAYEPPAVPHERAPARDAATMREPAAPRAASASREPVVSATSLSGVASERGPSLAPPRVLRQKSWLGAAAGGALLLLGGVTWLALGSDDPAGDSKPSAASPRSDAARAEGAPAPTAGSLSRSGRDTPVTSTLSTLSPRPAPSAEAAMESEPALTPTGGALPEPQIRIAPREEPSVAEAASSSPPGFGEAVPAPATPPVNSGEAASAAATGVASSSLVRARRSLSPSSPATAPTLASSAPARSAPEPAPAAPSEPAPAGAPKAPASAAPTAGATAVHATPTAPAPKPSTPADRTKKPSKNAEAYRIR